MLVFPTATVTVSIIGLLLPHQQTGPDGYYAQNNLPEMTASASAPVTVNVVRNQAINDPEAPPPPQAQPTPFTVTAHDADTYIYSGSVGGGTTKEFANPDLTCSVVIERYATAKGRPVFRGSASDGTCTWDLIVPGITVTGTPVVPHPAAVFVNKYKVADTQPTSSPLLLKDPDKEVEQTINVPAY